MIELMKKVSIVLLDKEKELALKNLRKLGLVHLEKIEGSSDKLSLFKEYSSNASIAESILAEIKLPKSQKKNMVDNLSNEQVVSLCAEVVEKNDRKKQLLDEISSNTNELERFTSWGNVCLEDLDYLKEKNLNIRLFEISNEKYNLIEDDVQTILVNNDKKNVRFIIIDSTEEEKQTKLMPEAFEVPLPRISTERLIQEINTNKEEIQEIEKFNIINAKYINSIKKFRKVLESDIEFENINSGMSHEDKGTNNDLAWISGFVPTEKIEEFLNFCKENQFAVSYADAQLDDSEVPTKLKNNKFVSLIYPLTDFLGTVPGYNEFDISGWFLLFFTIFFGMIFGDGGYGLLITIICLFMILKNKLAKKPFSSTLGLVLLVSTSTVVWGALTCTWFGIEPSLLPKWITKLSVPIFSGAYSDKIWVPFWITKQGIGLSKDQNLQIFCFTLALMQLSIAHIKAAKRNIIEKKYLKSLGDIGQLMQLLGMFWVVLSMVVDSTIFVMLGNIGSFPIGKVAISFIVIGFVLSFIFANYDGRVGESVLASCKNIISVLLGVVNVFSDIVSYIRLWAVGLAGAAISETVNQMAGPLLGHAILFIAAIALLLFGHGLNMILNLLSVIVHGVRLNTLEFTTHLGMSWSGIKYNPFREK